MVTKKEVAVAANVSAATVSNVFNKSKTVSPEIRAHVLKVASLLGYTDEIPKELVLLVNDVTNPHYYQIFEGMIDAADRFGYFVSMLHLKGSPIEMCQELIKRKVAAAFFTVPIDDSKAACRKMLENAGIAVAFSWDDFIIDFDPIMNKTVQYLASLGHTKIAYLSGLPLNSPENQRYISFLKAMERSNLEVDNTLIVDGIYPYIANMENGYWGMKGILDSTNSFSAVIALNDLMAIGAIRAINEAGLSIPKDISIIGCDNIPLSQYIAPPLTTLYFSAKELGQRTVYNLAQQLEGKAVTKVHINLDLVIRSTTAEANMHTI